MLRSAISNLPKFARKSDISEITPKQNKIILENTLCTGEDIWRFSKNNLIYYQQKGEHDICEEFSTTKKVFNVMGTGRISAGEFIENKNLASMTYWQLPNMTEL